MQDKVEDTEQVKKEIEKQAAKRAITRAKADSWDLNIAIFLFLVLIAVIILLFQGIGVEIVAPIAVLGLACVWLVGLRRRRKVYGRYYEEELVNLARELSMKAKKGERAQQTIEETIEEQVQKALCERYDLVRNTN